MQQSTNYQPSLLLKHGRKSAGDGWTRGAASLSEGGRITDFLCIPPAGGVASVLRQTAVRGRPPRRRFPLFRPRFDGGKMVGSADRLNPSRFLSSHNPASIT